jgi:hypothetical protein
MYPHKSSCSGGRSSFLLTPFGTAIHLGYIAQTEKGWTVFEGGMSHPTSRAPHLNLDSNSLKYYHAFAGN